MPSKVLPALFVGRRRWLIAALVGLGLFQAALSVFTAYLTPRFLVAGAGGWWLGATLVLGALLVGGVRIVERVISEEAGQDYVREVRRHLITSALVPDKAQNLGATISRSSNDLSAVKNWVAQGIAPIATGIPLILGILVSMFLLTPSLAVVLLVVLLVFGALMRAMAEPLFRRARGVRKVRGKMSGLIADTVTAGEAIRVSGGVKAEVQRVDKLSAKLVRASRERAMISGAMRGSAASITAVLSVLVAITGTFTGATAADITTAVFVSGLLATPITDLGRVGEYRQNLNAARVKLEPIIINARNYNQRERRAARALKRMRHHGNPPGLAHGAVHVADMRDREGRIPELVAAPGSRVLLTGQSTKRVERVIRDLVADRVGSDSWVFVAGRQIDGMPAKERRPYIGFASRDIPVERGTISRAVRYRARESDALELLDRVGLRERVERLPDGIRTTLRRGGEPLTPAERGLVKLARAIAGDPPLLILDQLDDQLDPPGRAVLREILEHYPGCVIIRSSDPESIMDVYDIWNVDELRASQILALPVHALQERGPRRTTHFSGSGESPFGSPPSRSAVDRALEREAMAMATAASEEDEDDV